MIDNFERQLAKAMYRDCIEHYGERAWNDMSYEGQCYLYLEFLKSRNSVDLELLPTEGIA